jgi:hypothetical protein
VRGYTDADAPLAFLEPRARTLSVTSFCSSEVPGLTTSTPTVFVSAVSLLCSLLLPRLSLAAAAAAAVRKLWDHNAGHTYVADGRVFVASDPKSGGPR